MVKTISAYFFITAGLLTHASVLHAQTYPARTIEMTVPYGAGGTTDAVSRRLASYLEKELGQPVVVVNKPGAQGTLQAAHLARAKSDGYTIGILGYTAITYTSQLMQVPYERNDFEMIGAIGSTSYGIVVSAESPIRNVDDLVVAAKKPEGVAYGITGAPNNLPILRLAKMTGGVFEQVLYKSGMEAVTAAAGKHVQMALQNPPDFAPLVKSGSLRLIASASAKRLAAFPEVPTMREQGYDISTIGLLGIAAPKGIPDEARQKLEAAVMKSVNDPEYIKFIEGIHGMQATPMAGAAFRKTVDEGYEAMGRMIKEHDIARIN
ncbi:hypothetical protein TKWG_00210 [Advenella kashmirensis WT001]|uniref:Tripartite tricarboxylate transporter substrate binding protein n=1 Tax=Advenella kashmirensis (strain DSM 17095 / LMG 22695 / WT001) TaxID=1036672 RepID=I3U6X8_ADVKW|nr:tripartite tricarboxylate transporter substrate binding protein [Advenella kashmirensis]AFK60766.1 hypothetical protein TKWG_00210 [Advenella kashmirensis WT001]